MSLLNALLETQEFATLPPVAAKVLKLLEKDNLDVREVAKVIETDATLTLKLLRVANSPLYATRTEVNNITQAILTLGLNRLTNIVLGVSIFSRFLMSSHKETAEVMEKFWWHASCTGIVAKTLAKKIGKNFKETEFIGGLLHDIGKLAMLQFDSAKFLETIEMVKTQDLFDYQAEERVFGVNHMEVGEEIAKLWKLPFDLTNVIAYHTYPDEAERNKPLVAVVRFSDILCELWGADIFEGFKSIDLSADKSWTVLCESFDELKDMDIEHFTFELEKDFKQSSEFLNLIAND